MPHFNTPITTLRIGPSAIADPLAQSNAMTILYENLRHANLPNYPPSIGLAIFSVMVYCAFKRAYYMQRSSKIITPTYT